MDTQPGPPPLPVEGLVHPRFVILTLIYLARDWAFQAGLTAINKGLQTYSGYRPLSTNETRSELAQHFEMQLGAFLRSFAFFSVTCTRF